MATYLPFHEPEIITILILASFLLLLNVVNHFLDGLIYCGLVGQILLGVAWGSPGGNWIDIDAQNTFMQLGYLGLLLMVYEGGLSTNFKLLKENILLATMIALTGVTVPMGISFSILGYSDATIIGAFAAGAALCSTSLGTTFAILLTSGLKETKVGVLLASAAVMDDIVGLVMIQVISNLGDESFRTASVIRPIFVSIGLIVVVILAFKFIILPSTIWYSRNRQSSSFNKINKIFMIRKNYFALHTLVLIGLITGATYAGASNLTAAYIIGAAISWWDDETSNSITSQNKEIDESVDQRPDAVHPNDSIFIRKTHSFDDFSDDPGKDTNLKERCTGIKVFEVYYGQVVDKVFRPLFFASIGFSIPITQMFTGRLIWRGFIYAFLMALSKMMCGLWLIRCKHRTTIIDNPEVQDTEHYSKGGMKQIFNRVDTFPSALLGLAMVPRGEIGFLISSLAESNGVFSPSGRISSNGASSDVYVIVTWAIVFCTFFGPVGVGFLVRKIKQTMSAGNASPLGIWD